MGELHPSSCLFFYLKHRLEFIQPILCVQNTGFTSEVNLITAPENNSGVGGGKEEEVE